MTTLECKPPRAAIFLERALLFNFAIHAVAMSSMALLLLPGTPGGKAGDVAGRAAYVAGHPWLWRLGWFPWQLTAFADVLLGVALLCTRWIPRWPAFVTLLLTLAAIVPDQSGQFLWVTRGVRLAQDAVQSGNFADYLHFETVIFKNVAAWGCVGYLAGALGWTWCFAAAKTWSRSLTWVSIASWGVFTVSAVFIFLPPDHRPPSIVAAAGNAVGFILLQIWLILVTEQVLRRSRPAGITAAWMPWRAPFGGMPARILNTLANGRFARMVVERIPPPAMVSDIRDVVYISYVVPVERLLQFVPPGLEIQRLGPGGAFATFSILTFRHGHFGPRFLGKLRWLAPSPVQCNWRIYVTDPATGHAGVYFLSTSISSAFYAIATRWLCEGVPMHLLKSAMAGRNERGQIQLAIDPGSGSGNDLHATMHEPAHAGALPQTFAACFANYRDLFAHCVPQDCALAPQPWYGTTARQQITLGIALEDCIVVEGLVESQSARKIVGDAEPVCFTIRRVTFRFDREYRDQASLQLPKP